MAVSSPPCPQAQESLKRERKGRAVKRQLLIPCLCPLSHNQARDIWREVKLEFLTEVDRKVMYLPESVGRSMVREK